MFWQLHSVCVTMAIFIYSHAIRIVIAIFCFFFLLFYSFSTCTWHCFYNYATFMGLRLSSFAISRRLWRLFLDSCLLFAVCSQLIPTGRLVSGERFTIIRGFELMALYQDGLWSSHLAWTVLTAVWFLSKLLLWVPSGTQVSLSTRLTLPVKSLVITRAI